MCKGVHFTDFRTNVLVHKKFTIAAHTFTVSEKYRKMAFVVQSLQKVILKYCTKRQQNILGAGLISAIL